MDTVDIPQWNHRSVFQGRCHQESDLVEKPQEGSCVRQIKGKCPVQEQAPGRGSKEEESSTETQM